MECENSVYRNANEVIDRIQVKKKNPRASNENKEEPKIAFFVSTLAVIYTSVLVFVVSVVLSVVAIILVSKYKDDSIASSVMLQRNTTQEFQALQIQFEDLQTQLNNSNSQIQALQSQLLKYKDDSIASSVMLQRNTTQEFQALQIQFEDLQTQLNNSNSQIQALQSQIFRTDKQVGILQSVLTDSNEDIQSQLNESIVSYQLQLNNSNLEIHDLLSDTTQAILTQINSSNVEIQELQSEIEILTRPCPGSDASQPASSCQQVLNCKPDAPSDHYFIISENSAVESRYCNMNRVCGGVDGGWMRVVQLDTRESGSLCPVGLVGVLESNKNLCRSSSSIGCSQVFFETNNVSYDQVCGKIIAYQFGSTDSFGLNGSPIDSIDEMYLDGISLTYGSNPRKHIWSFAAALDEVSTMNSNSCPCIHIKNAADATPPPDFVGSDYFCDTGSTDRFTNGIVYGDDPLWDGAGCGPANTCCSLNNPPWFFKQIQSPTTSNIEMRVCHNEGRVNEDILIEQIEIFIR
ncbi:uncharacterized protein LOC135347140 [Halichondria panicea]|uniref:uncharacterized protein LOC135347140 n=1 Tax=Halichondria panicea TaxID=6063 RepID=UPI00312B67A8